MSRAGVEGVALLLFPAAGVRATGILWVIGWASSSASAWPSRDGNPEPVGSSKQQVRADGADMNDVGGHLEDHLATQPWAAQPVLDPPRSRLLTQRGELEPLHTHPDEATPRRA